MIPMTNTAREIDVSKLHAAMEQLEAVRRGPNICLGYDGIFDVFGGSLRTGDLRWQGLPGAVNAYIALQKLTMSAWELIHGASRRVKAEQGSAYASTDWCVKYNHGYTRLVLTKDGKTRGFNSHAAAVRAAKKLGGSVVNSEEVLAERIDLIHEQVKTAVRVMLAASEVYNELVMLGVVRAEGQCITQGNNGEVLWVTGLRWLAGDSREPDMARVTVAEAVAFVSGLETVKVFARES